MTRPGGYGGWVTNGKLDDDGDHEFTKAPLPQKPCARCGEGPMDWPHSICRNCQEQSRAYKVMKEKRK